MRLHTDRQRGLNIVQQFLQICTQKSKTISAGTWWREQDTFNTFKEIQYIHCLAELKKEEIDKQPLIKNWNIILNIPMHKLRLSFKYLKKLRDVKVKVLIRWKRIVLNKDLKQTFKIIHSCCGKLRSCSKAKMWKTFCMSTETTYNIKSWSFISLVCVWHRIYFAVETGTDQDFHCAEHFRTMKFNLI